MPIDIISLRNKEQEKKENTARYHEIICSFCMRFLEKNYRYAFSADEIALEIKILSLMSTYLDIHSLPNHLEYEELEDAFTYFGPNSKECIIFALLIYNDDISSTDKRKKQVYFFCSKPK